MEQNIILLGPKAVGKSVIAPALQAYLKKQGLGDYDVLSLDVFFKRCQDAFNETLFFPESTRRRMLNREIAQLDPNDPEFEKLKAMLTDDFEKSYDEIFEFTEKYYLPDFKDLAELFQETATTQQQTHFFSNDTFMIFDQTIYLKVLERVLKKAKKPLIIDAGGNIGPIHDYTESDLMYAQYRFPDIDIKTFQKKVLDTIPIKVYIEPSEEYDSLSCVDIHDKANSLYRKNPESYKRFANVTLQAGRLYMENFENFDRSNPVEKIKASKYLSKKAVEDACEEIVKQILNMKIFE